jgi:hypothetical protein
MTTGGFPHSDIPGSRPVYDSPGLFAVHHVLPRRRAPRHPPYALPSLDSACSRVCVSDSDHLLLMAWASDLRWLHDVKELISRTARAVPHGDERIRTADLLLARQALSHLSYAPSNQYTMRNNNNASLCIACMGLPGLEPGTSRLSGVRSQPPEL